MSVATFDPEFDTVYAVTARGTITPADGVAYIPTVEHDDTHDVLIDGGPTRARSNGDIDVNSGWDVLTGYTGQYGYQGAVMHPSEQWTPAMLEELAGHADSDGIMCTVFAVVVVNAPCAPDAPCFPNDPDYCADNGCDAAPAGWAVIYRTIGA